MDNNKIWICPVCSTVNHSKECLCSKILEYNKTRKKTYHLIRFHLTKRQRAIMKVKNSIGGLLYSGRDRYCILLDIPTIIDSYPDYIKKICYCINHEFMHLWLLLEESELTSIDFDNINIDNFL